jgi:hypothetical protein
LEEVINDTIRWNGHDLGIIKKGFESEGKRKTPKKKTEIKMRTTV